MRRNLAVAALLGLSFTGLPVVSAAADPGSVCRACSGAEDNPAGDTVVAPGDTLSGLAARYGIAGGAAELYAKNSSVLPDADTITAGQRLLIGGADRPQDYSVSIAAADQPDQKPIRLRVSSVGSAVIVVQQDELGHLQVGTYSDRRRGLVIDDESQLTIDVSVTRGGRVIADTSLNANDSLFIDP